MSLAMYCLCVRISLVKVLTRRQECHDHRGATEVATYDFEHLPSSRSYVESSRAHVNRACHPKNRPAGAKGVENLAARAREVPCSPAALFSPEISLLIDALIFASTSWSCESASATIDLRTERVCERKNRERVEACEMERERSEGGSTMRAKMGVCSYRQTVMLCLDRDWG